MDKALSKYAIPCAFTDEDGFDAESVFFLTFNTKSEDEALKLASCVCGKRKAHKALVIVTENGDIFYP